MLFGAFLLAQLVAVLTLFHKQLSSAFDYTPLSHDGGWPLPHKALVLLVSGGVVALVARRGRAPRWSVLGASLAVAACGAFGLRPESGDEARRLLRWWSNPDDFVAMGFIRAFDGIGSWVASCFLGALLALSGSLALAARARRGADKKARGPRFWLSLPLIFPGLVLTLAALAPRSTSQPLAQLFPLYIATITAAALAAAAPSLAAEPRAERRQLLIEALTLALVAVSLASLSASLSLFMSEPGPDQEFWARIAAAPRANLRPDYGFAGYPALSLHLAVIGWVLLGRRGEEAPPGWPCAAAALGGPALWLLLFRVVAGLGLDELHEGRLGKPGELILDRRIPAGDLWVDLMPAVESTDAYDPATFSLAGVNEQLGRPRDRTPKAPAVFSGLPALTTISLLPSGPYEFASIDVALPPGKGGRVSVPVLSHSPRFDRPWTPDDYYLPKIFRLQLFAGAEPPEMMLTQGNAIIMSVTFPPFERNQLAERLRREWMANGEHRDRADRKFDTFVIHHPPGMPFDRLAEIAREVNSVTRELYRGGETRSVPVFRLYTSTRSDITLRGRGGRR